MVYILSSHIVTPCIVARQPARKEKDGGTRQQSPRLNCMEVDAGKKRKSNLPELRVLCVRLNETWGLIPTPTKTSLLRSKKLPSSKDVNSENVPSSPVMSLRQE